MEFLRLFLRRRFACKSVVASRNVSCFLRLVTFQSLKLLSSDSTWLFSENKDNFVYFLRNTYMRRHCLRGYLPKQVEKICLQNNCTELNSRDVKAIGAGYSLWPIREGTVRKGSFFQESVYERAGKFVIAVCETTCRANRRILWQWKRQENFVV